MSQTTIIRDRRIKNLIIKNFQNHIYTHVNFEKGLNMIAGSSDCGKSAISRAIIFALYNKPEGIDFIYFGEKTTEIYIEFFDGSIFIRTKSRKGTNKVEYKYPEDKNFTAFDKFGSHYNEAILTFLGFPTESDILGIIPYSEQSNKNFLIDLSPNHIPSAISSLIGVNDLDEAAILLNSNLKVIEKDIKSKENIKTKLDEKLENDFIGLDDTINELDKLKKLKNTIVEKQKYLDQLEQAKIGFDKINKKGQELKEEQVKTNLIYETLKSYLEKLEKLFSTYSNYSDAYNENIRLSENLEIKESEYKFYSDIIENGLDKIIQKLEVKHGNYEKMIDLDNKLTSSQSDIEENEKDITDLNEEITSTNNLLEDLIAEIKGNEAYCKKCNTFGGIEI